MCTVVFLAYPLAVQSRWDSHLEDDPYALPPSTGVAGEVSMPSPCTLSPALLLLHHCGFMSTHAHGMEDLAVSAGHQG